MSFITDWFITFIYQPFFNLLVGTYMILDSVTHGNADMGMAVIIFTIIFRILWMPVSLASGRSYKEKAAIAKKVAKYEETYRSDPVMRKNKIKDLFKGNKRIVIISGFNILLQTLIALMLWRVFARGLKGQDLHMLYSFIPEIKEPFNLVFNGKYDLTRPNWTLNIIQALVIFVYEALTALFSTETKYRREVVMAQFILPLMSLAIFAMMPAGKKLFIIVTLCFSIVQISIRQLLFWWKGMSKKIDKIGMKAAGFSDEKEDEDKGKKEEKDVIKDK